MQQSMQSIYEKQTIFLVLGKCVAQQDGGLDGFYKQDNHVESYFVIQWWEPGRSGVLKVFVQ